MRETLAKSRLKWNILVTLLSYFPKKALTIVLNLIPETRPYSTVQRNDVIADAVLVPSIQSDDGNPPAGFDKGS